MSIAFVPIAGVILGWKAGIIAAIVGNYIGVLIAPYTAALGLLTPFRGAIFSAMAAGLMTRKEDNWWTNFLFPAVLMFPICWIIDSPIAYGLFMGYPWPYGSGEMLPPLEFAAKWPIGLLHGYTNVYPSWILMLATSKWVRGWVKSTDIKKLTLGMLVIGYFSVNIDWNCIGALFTFMYGGSMEVGFWITTLFTTWERALLGIMAAVFGTAVIVALRQAGIRKPEDTIW